MIFAQREWRQGRVISDLLSEVGGFSGQGVTPQCQSATASHQPSRHQPRTPPRLLVSSRKQRRTQGHSVWKRPGCIGAPSMRANPLALQSTLWFRGPAPDAGVSAKSQLRRLYAAKTGRIEYEGTSHGAFLAADGESTSQFCECRVQIRLRSALREEAGGRNRKCNSCVGPSGVCVCHRERWVGCDRPIFFTVFLLPGGHRRAPQSTTKATFEHATTCWK